MNKEFRPKTDQAKEAVENAVKTPAQQALENTVTVSSDAYRTIRALIAEIDEKLSQQINQIIHHDDFQKLEGARHGLHYLVNNSETDEMLKIRFMSISKQELGRTLKRYKGVGWDQSPIFKKIYEEEYGQFGGEPFGCPWATTTSITARRTWSCWAKWPRSAPPRTARSSPAPRRA